MTDLGVQPQSATTPKSDQSLSDLNVDPQLKPWASPAGVDRILRDRSKVICMPEIRRKLR